MYRIGWMILGVVLWYVVPEWVKLLYCFAINLWRIHRFFYWDAKLKPGITRRSLRFVFAHATVAEFPLIWRAFSDALSFQTPEWLSE